MRLQAVVIWIAVVLAGCATRPLPSSPPPAAVPERAAEPAPRPAPVYEYRYRVLTAEATGTEQVFDDGQRTYVSFHNAAPAGVLFFQQDGRPLRSRIVDRFAILDGVHPGVLIRSTTRYSYAAPLDTLRVAAVRVRPADGIAARGQTELPPELAARRAVILELEGRSRSGERRSPAARSLADPRAVNPELDQSETVLDGIATRTVRVYFANGRSHISLSPGAREILRLAARNSERITLRGRTDNVGGQAANLRIARARTNAARSLLLAFGVPASRIEIDAAGLTDYMADNGSEQGRARNRRVEMVFVQPDTRAVPAEEGRAF